MWNRMERIAASFGWLAALIVASGAGWRHQPATPSLHAVGGYRRSRQGRPRLTSDGWSGGQRWTAQLEGDSPPMGSRLAASHS